MKLTVAGKEYTIVEIEADARAWYLRAEGKSRGTPDLVCGIGHSFNEAMEDLLQEILGPVTKRTGSE